MATFLELARAARAAHRIEAQTLARLAMTDAGESAAADFGLLEEAAAVLAELAPYERTVRKILRGELPALPGYTGNLQALRIGSTGLWRGEVRDVHEAECQVRFAGRGVSTTAWIGRAELVGLAIEPP